MMIEFSKYEGTGNDFIILDNREGMYSSITKEQVAFLCNRHFGIGADGLMLLQLKEGYDFEMIYFNADGGEGSMCGNGGRCLTAYAKKLDVIKYKAHFFASDGDHNATINETGNIELKMKDVTDVERYKDYCVLNTGSPHYIQWVTDTKTVDVVKEGKAIRYGERFGKVGINVNFVQVQPTHLTVRTYERGVEDETLSCGTGVTASAIAAANETKDQQEISVITSGGQLSVKFKRTGNSSFTDIWLCGPAKFVFEGSINLTSLK